MHNKYDNKGFTLVELAIVLVIIGLIIGGVMAGSELIKQAHFRAEISSLDRYQVAMNTFQLKYNAMPGDMKNASTMITGVTHNGDGDGMIDAAAASDWWEYVYVWEHLSKAGLIDGFYQGNFDAGGTCNGLLSANSCPKSKLFTGDVLWMGGGLWLTSLYGLPAASSDAYNMITWVLPGNWQKGALPITDVKALDIKVDDGNASHGRLVAFNDGFLTPTTTNCVTGVVTDTDGTPNYKPTTTAQDCGAAYFVK